MSTQDETFEVDGLKLAAWLRLNNEKLLDRTLLPDGKVLYRFRRSPQSDELMRQWEERNDYRRALSHYAQLVSNEIRKAVRLRRAQVP